MTRVLLRLASLYWVIIQFFISYQLLLIKPSFDEWKTTYKTMLARTEKVKKRTVLNKVKMKFVLIVWTTV